MNQSSQWRERVTFATLDLSGAYKAVLDACLPDATQVADPFHVIKVRHEALRYRGRVRDPPRRAVAAVR
jgi:transposase